MRNMWTIAAREYKGYFSGFLAYLFTFLLFLVTGWLMYLSLLVTQQSFGQYPPPDPRVVVGPMMFVLLIACPAFTMRSLSEELRQGTIELLLTAPLREFELVAGKWLGSFLFVGTVVLTTLIYPVVLNAVIDPGIDPLMLFSGYLGVLMCVAAFLAIGVFISSLFSNMAAAYIVSFLTLLFFWSLLGFFSQVGSSPAPVVDYLNMNQHFDNFFRGLISLSSMVYLSSLTFFALVLGAVSLEIRRWS